MKLLNKQEKMTSLVVSANKSDTNVRADYHTAFVSAVAGITGIDNTTDLGKQSGVEQSNGHGNITVLTHLVSKINTKSAYRKKIVAWLEFYCDVHYNTSELKFEYKVEDGIKQKISPLAWEVLVEYPFWEKLPNQVSEFDYDVRFERLQKSIDKFIKDAINSGMDLEESNTVVLSQLLLSGKLELSEESNVVDISKAA